MSAPAEGITRRRALALAGAGALWLGGCGSGPSGPGPAADGSTRLSTWHDPAGDGQLRVGPGEPLRPRTDLGHAATADRVLATIGYITDAHVMDAASPARVPFLDRLGPPFQSTFRPQEALTAHVLSGTILALRALGADAVIQGGDLIDNDQANELRTALTLLGGGTADPGSGPHGYYGVQSEINPDPFYYRPDLDAPRHPKLLRAATRRLHGEGLGVPWYPTLGDHDILVQGELVPVTLTQQLAVGTKALWDLPQGLTLPPGTEVTSGGSPDGPILPDVVNQLLARALQGPTVHVPADAGRRELDVGEVMQSLHAHSALRHGSPLADDRLDYGFDVGDSVRVLVLDLARRDGGSGGLVVDGQAQWLDSQLSAVRDRWVIVISHQPLISSEGGDALMAVMDGSPRVIAALAGHIHRNRVVPRHTPNGGYWLITTSSLIDYPQQSRALQIVATTGGGVAIRTWMLNHVEPGGIGAISRQLSFLDAQGGRPLGFSGSALDRNVTLYRAK